MKQKAAFSIEDLRKTAVAGINPHLFADPPPKDPKRNKFNASKTEIDGIVFDSKKEAKRYKELQLLLKAGVIGLLQLQVPYELNEGGSHSLKYVADFVYIRTDTGEKVVEDTKGFRTTIYKKKRKLMKKIHGIEIREL